VRLVRSASARVDGMSWVVHMPDGTCRLTTSTQGRCCPLALGGRRASCTACLAFTRLAVLFVHPICAAGSSLKERILKQAGYWFMDSEGNWACAARCHRSVVTCFWMAWFCAVANIKMCLCWCRLRASPGLFKPGAHLPTAALAGPHH
jgi:hypothetical protein